MALLTGTINNVFGCTNPLGPIKNASNYEIRSCYLTFSIAGTYVQNDNATITGVNTAIQNATRDGRTVQALIDVAMAAPGDENATLIGVKTLAISTFAVTFELTGSDLSTEHTGALLADMNRDICLFVTYTVSQS